MYRRALSGKLARASFSSAIRCRYGHLTCHYLNGYCNALPTAISPLQLPATVRSQAAMKAGLDISLFERLASAGIAPLLLRTQYRCAQSGGSQAQTSVRQQSLCMQNAFSDCRF